MFVPPLLATIGFTIQRWWNRRRWNWPDALPGLVLVSLLCAPYGAWPFDMVLLLVPWVHSLAVAVRTRAVVPMAVAMMALPLSWFIYSIIQSLRIGVWYTPAMLIGWVAVLMLSRAHADVESSS